MSMPKFWNWDCSVGQHGLRYSMLSHAATSIPKFWQRKIPMSRVKNVCAKFLFLRLQYTTAWTTITYAVVYCNLNSKILAEENPEVRSRKCPCQNFGIEVAVYDSMDYDNLCCRVLQLQNQNFDRGKFLSWKYKMSVPKFWNHECSVGQHWQRYSMLSCTAFRIKKFWQRKILKLKV